MPSKKRVSMQLNRQHRPAGRGGSGCELNQCGLLSLCLFSLLAANKAKRSGGLSSSVALPGDLYLGLLFTVEEYRVYVLFSSLHTAVPCIAAVAVSIPPPPTAAGRRGSHSFLRFAAFLCVCSSWLSSSYGYQTNTKVKLVVILQDCTQEVNMKSWFRDLHTLYLATQCNPFSDLQGGGPIQNPTFEKNINKLVLNWFYVERK
jgi:hypothetical protein